MGGNTQRIQESQKITSKRSWKIWL
jgi:hypothetical protein